VVHYFTFADPKVAELHENMGFLRFSDGNDDHATQEFSTAYELDNQRYLSLFFKTMLFPAAWSDCPADLDALREDIPVAPASANTEKTAKSSVPN